MTDFRSTRVLTALVAVSTLFTWAACTNDGGSDSEPGVETAVVPLVLADSTHAAVAEEASQILGDGYDPTLDHPVGLDDLDPEVGARLVAESGDAGVVGASVDEAVFDRTPIRVDPEDLNFFVVENVAAETSLLAPTGDRRPMPGNESLGNAVESSLDQLDSIDLETDRFRDVLSRTRFHEVDEFPTALPDSVEGATYEWEPKSHVRVAGLGSWLLFWWDGYHHVVLSVPVAEQLLNGEYSEDGGLTVGVQVALGALSRLLMAESSCTSENLERIVGVAKEAFAALYVIEQARESSSLPSTADVLTYHGAVRDILELGGADCLEALGLPYAGGIEIEAPGEVPVGTEVEVTVTLTWPDGFPAAEQFVVLILEGRHQVVLTDGAGGATHTFPAGDAPGEIEAIASSLGVRARTDVRVVAGSSGACCLPDGSCVVVFPEDCTAADGVYVGTDIGCDPDPCEDLGACCDEAGICTLQTLDDCVAAGSLFLGAHASCIPNACPPNGACCLADGSCSIGSPEDCELAGGVFQGEGTLCDTDPCDFGACCFEDGSCRQATEIGCENLEGIWQGPGTGCEMVECEGPGACCFPDGSCTVTAAAECIGEFLGEDTTCDPNPCPQPGACCVGGGVCQVTLAADCDGEFLGGGTICDPNPCPQPGACCFEDGSCVVSLEADCGGTFLGGGTACAPNPCPQPPTGACCWGEDGTRCAIRTESECERELGGTYLGHDTNCFSEPCQDPMAGACCLPSGNCLFLDPGSCAEAGGTHQGVGVPCSDEVCPEPVTGACCFETGNCQVRTEKGCTEDGGVYEGDEVSCDPNPCAGACCFPSGVCQVLTETACETQGAEYQGDATSCDPNPCTETGACCFPGGECQVLLALGCTDADGAFLGGDSACDPNPCPQPGACCLVTGACQAMTEEDCSEIGGDFLGAEAECDPNPCPQSGACCLSDGSCVVVTADQCVESEGAYQGDDSNCEAESCPQPGACCIGTSCQVLLESECVEADGAFLGEGSNCDPDPCAPQGACCFPDGSCQVGEEGDCDGDFQGAGSTCDPNPCEAVGACCLLDGSCLVVDEGFCEGSLGGVYQGDGTLCSEGCTVGACCLPDGSCVEVTPSECVESDGVFVGLEPCMPETCEVYGACCRRDGSCDLVLSAQSCQMAGGYYAGEGSDCLPDPCPSAGACCLTDGSCIMDDLFNCGLVDGDYLGDGTLCLPDPCPSVGACCLPEDDCVVVEVEECDGEFLGEGTTCDPNPCDAGAREISTNVGENEGVTVANRKGALPSSGNGPGDLFVAGSQGVAAYDLATGTFRGHVTQFPTPFTGTVFLETPPEIESDTDAWLLMYGPDGAMRRGWSPEFGWTFTQLLFWTVLDASAYDNRADGRGFAICDFGAGWVAFHEFNEEGGLIVDQQFDAVTSYATGPPISAFARTAPGGEPGGEALFVTNANPGQLWHPDRESSEQPTLIGEVGDDPIQIRAAGEVAVVTNQGSNSLTVISWPYGGTPVITETVPVGDTPVGVGVAELTSGNVVAATTGFADDTLTLTVISPSGSVLSNDTMAAPSGCEAPGFAVMAEGGALEVVISCNGSSNVFVLPVDVE